MMNNESNELTFLFLTIASLKKKTLWSYEDKYKIVADTEKKTFDLFEKNLKNKHYKKIGRKMPWEELKNVLNDPKYGFGRYKDLKWIN